MHSFRGSIRLFLLASLGGLLSTVSVASADTPACLSAPALPAPSGQVVTVANVSQLNSAIASLSNSSTIVIKPGRYQLTTTLYVNGKNNVTIRGESDRCDAVELIGKGMENANRGNVGSGIWVNSNNVTIANLTISETYLHPIELNGGPDFVHIYNVRLLNAGQQFIKSSSAGGFGQGADFGKVEYSIMAYTNGPPITDHAGGGTGYTNGVDVHGGDGWQIRNNLFKSFHTPDNADHLWNPAILMWNGSRNTLSENNVFINVDRAIAYGLLNRSNDHQGGIIRNNMVTMTPGLYSASRTSGSDAPIILWSSPNTKVLHNTVLTNGNTLKAIELRFGSSGVEVANNVSDGPIVYREGSAFNQSNNYTEAIASLFVNGSVGDLHLRSTASAVINKVARRDDALFDIDGQPRPTGQMVDLGADEQLSLSPPLAPGRITITPIYDLLLEK